MEIKDGGEVVKNRRWKVLTSIAKTVDQSKGQQAGNKTSAIKQNNRFNATIILTCSTIRLLVVKDGLTGKLLIRGELAIGCGARPGDIIPFVKLLPNLDEPTLPPNWFNRDPCNRHKIYTIIYWVIV